MMGYFEYFVLGLLTMLVSDSAERLGRLRSSALGAAVAFVWFVCGVLSALMGVMA